MNYESVKQEYFIMNKLIILCTLYLTVTAFKPTRFQRLQSTYLPQKQVPHDIYGPPPQNPPQEYGPPTEPNEATTTEVPTTTEGQSEIVNPSNNGTAEEKGRLSKGQGLYYIYHPDGHLQKVVFSSKKKGKSVTAQVKYEDVEPIRGPIFTYSPQDLVLRPYLNQWDCKIW